MQQLAVQDASAQWAYLDDFIHEVIKLNGWDKSHTKRLFAAHRLAYLRPMLVHRSGDYTVVHGKADQSYTILAESILLDNEDFRRLSESKQRDIVYSDIAWSIPSLVDWMKRSKINIEVGSFSEWMSDSYPALKSSNQIFI